MSRVCQTLGAVAVCWLLAVTHLNAGGVVPRLVIDGVTYQDVRWGPVSDGTITFFHNRGVKTGVPLDKLPPDIQRQFGYVPSRSSTGSHGMVLPPSGQANSAFARFQRQLARQRYEAEAGQRRTTDAHQNKYAVLDGKVVAVSELTRLVGFLQSRAEVQIDEQTIYGYMLDLARLRNPEREIPPEMLLRPGLWEKTGEQVFLVGYQTDELLGSLLQLHGLEQEPILEHRSFVIGMPPTAQQVRGLP